MNRRNFFKGLFGAAVENDPKLPKESLLNKIKNAIGSLPDIP